MAEAAKRKTSYDFDAKVKHKLESLKSDLKLRGLTGVFETAITEALVESAKVGDLEARLSAVAASRAEAPQFVRRERGDV